MNVDYDEYGKEIHLKLWELLIQELNFYENEIKISSKYKPKYSKTELCIKNIMLCLTYPRLDINVSKHLNHLLKAPFCIHPKTGLLSVPLNEKDILNFKMENITEIDDTIDSINHNRYLLLILGNQNSHIFMIISKILLIN